MSKPRLSRRRLFGATALAGVALAGGGGAIAYARTPGSIDEYLADALPQDASLSVVAVRDREVVYHRGFGLADRKRNRRCGLNTAFDTGSLTKQFTAASILRLEQDGELDVKDRVSRYLPGPIAGERGITIHHLLTHTAGLGELTGVGDYDPVSREDMLTAATEMKPLTKPGAKHHYSNLGYSVLAAVVETVTSRGYEDFLHEKLFRPAGMRHTGYLLPDWRSADIAMQYDEHGEAEGRPNELGWDDDGPYWVLRGNGGIIATPKDMAAWQLALEGDDVLGPKAKRKLFKPYVPEDDSRESFYGYGWAITDDDAGRRIAWHDGSNGWSTAILARSLDEGTMVFMATNAADWEFDGQTVAMELLEWLRE
ncbi:MAG: serine hydrolase domain-containing protein [Stackebrandtia sp.]